MYHLAGEAVSGGVGDHVSAAGGGGAVMNNAGELVTLIKLQIFPNGASALNGHNIYTRKCLRPMYVNTCCKN